MSEPLAQLWLALIAPLFDRERWSQGRWHARVGRVVSLDVRAGLVTARLEGGRATPRWVTLRVPTLSAADQRRTLDVLSSQAQHGAALAAGRVPAALYDALRAADIWLLPKHCQHVQLTCTCSDGRKQPCKHAAAVCFTLADRLDADPLAAFTLRGYDSDQLLTVLRVRRALPTAQTWFDSPDFELLTAALHGAVTRHATGVLSALELADPPARLRSAPAPADHPGFA